MARYEELNRVFANSLNVRWHETARKKLSATVIRYVWDFSQTYMATNTCARKPTRIAPTIVWRLLFKKAPCHGTPTNIRMNIILSKNGPWATFLPRIVCVHLFPNFRGELRKTHHLWSGVRYGRSRSSKVVDFGVNWKRPYELLLVININLDPILHRFWDTVTYRLEIVNFPTPLI